LKLSKVLMVEEVEDPFTHPNQRLIPLYDPRDINLIHLCRSSADRRFQEISTIGKQLKLMRKSLARHELTSISGSIE
jgi:hypothetical protein